MKKIFKLFIFLLAAVGVLAIIALFFNRNNSDKQKDQLYSENQTRVIKNFGKPQTFKFVTQNDQTLEYWRYLYLDEIFIFQNGEFVASQHYNFDLEENEAIYFQLEPADFYQNKSIANINQLINSEPTLEADIDNDILGEGYKFYSYGQLLDVTTNNDSVEVIDTVAIKKSANAEIVDNYNTTTKTAEEEKGKVFIGASDLDESSFSYYLDDEKFRYIKQRNLVTNDGEKSTKLYGYCYTLDEGLSFSDTPQDPYACADNESMLWTIEIFSLDNYKQLDEIDKAYHEQLAKNDQYIYVLSHANGDFPTELPTWTSILSEIKTSFSVPMAEKYKNTLN